MSNSPSLLKAIGGEVLTAHFEFLDRVRESGRVNMWGAHLVLQKHHAGMTSAEAVAIANAWRVTFSESLPAEDRAGNALEAVDTTR